jgi:hypothetical protein
MESVGLLEGDAEDTGYPPAPLRERLHLLAGKRLKIPNPQGKCRFLSKLEA